MNHAHNFEGPSYDPLSALHGLAWMEAFYSAAPTFATREYVSAVLNGFALVDPEGFCEFVMAVSEDPSLYFAQVGAARIAAERAFAAEWN